jgi:hypothetical protein
MGELGNTNDSTIRNFRIIQMEVARRRVPMHMKALQQRKVQLELTYDARVLA